MFVLAAAGGAAWAGRSDLRKKAAGCKKVDTRVDCYKVCPDIDNDGTFRQVSPSWRERCSS